MAAAKNLQSAEVIGRLFGITPRYVRQLTADGVLKAEKEKNRYLYDLLPTIQTYIKHLEARAAAKEEKARARGLAEIESQKRRAEADLKQSQAGVARMKARDLEAIMHRAADVEAMTNDLIYTIREKIEALPDRLDVEVLRTAGSAAEASAMIRAECYEILNELAGYEFNAEAAEERRKVYEKDVQVL